MGKSKSRRKKANRNPPAPKVNPDEDDDPSTFNPSTSANDANVPLPHDQGYSQTPMARERAKLKLSWKDDIFAQPSVQQSMQAVKQLRSRAVPTEPLPKSVQKPPKPPKPKGKKHQTGPESSELDTDQIEEITESIKQAANFVNEIRSGYEYLNITPPGPPQNLPQLVTSPVVNDLNQEYLTPASVRDQSLQVSFPSLNEPGDGTQNYGQTDSRHGPTPTTLITLQVRPVNILNQRENRSKQSLLPQDDERVIYQGVAWDSRLGVYRETEQGDKIPDNGLIYHSLTHLLYQGDIYQSSRSAQGMYLYFRYLQFPIDLGAYTRDNPFIVYINLDRQIFHQIYQVFEEVQTNQGTPKEIGMGHGGKSGTSPEGQPQPPLSNDMWISPTGDQLAQYQNTLETANQSIAHYLSDPSVGSHSSNSATNSNQPVNGNSQSIKVSGQNRPINQPTPRPRTNYPPKPLNDGDSQQLQINGTEVKSGKTKLIEPQHPNTQSPPLKDPRFNEGNSLNHHTQGGSKSHKPPNGDNSQQIHTIQGVINSHSMDNGPSEVKNSPQITVVHSPHNTPQSGILRDSQSRRITTQLNQPNGPFPYQTPPINKRNGPKVTFSDPNTVNSQTPKGTINSDAVPHQSNTKITPPGYPQEQTQTGTPSSNKSHTARDETETSRASSGGSELDYRYFSPPYPHHTRVPQHQTQYYSMDNTPLSDRHPTTPRRRLYQNSIPTQYQWAPSNQQTDPPQPMGQQSSHNASDDPTFYSFQSDSRQHSNVKQPSATDRRSEELQHVLDVIQRREQQSQSNIQRPVAAPRQPPPTPSLHLNEQEMVTSTPAVPPAHVAPSPRAPLVQYHQARSFRDNASSNHHTLPSGQKLRTAQIPNYSYEEGSPQITKDRNYVPQSVYEQEHYQRRPTVVNHAPPESGNYVMSPQRPPPSYKQVSAHQPQLPDNQGTDQHHVPNHGTIPMDHEGQRSTSHTPREHPPCLICQQFECEHPEQCDAIYHHEIKPGSELKRCYKCKQLGHVDVACDYDPMKRQFPNTPYPPGYLYPHYPLRASNQIMFNAEQEKRNQSLNADERIFSPQFPENNLSQNGYNAASSLMRNPRDRNPTMDRKPAVTVMSSIYDIQPNATNNTNGKIVAGESPEDLHPGQPRESEPPPTVPPRSFFGQVEDGVNQWGSFHGFYYPTDNGPNAFKEQGCHFKTQYQDPTTVNGSGTSTQIKGFDTRYHQYPIYTSPPQQPIINLAPPAPQLLYGHPRTQYAGQNPEQPEEQPASQHRPHQQLSYLQTSVPSQIQQLPQQFNPQVPPPPQMSQHHMPHRETSTPAFLPTPTPPSRSDPNAHDLTRGGSETPHPSTDASNTSQTDGPLATDRIANLLNDTMQSLVQGQRSMQDRTDELVGALVRNQRHDHVLRDISTFQGKKQDLENWILEIERAAMVTEIPAQELALQKTLGTPYKMIIRLGPRVSWAAIKAKLQEVYSPIPTDLHASSLLGVPQRKDESLQDYITTFTDLCMKADGRDPTTLNSKPIIAMFIRNLYNKEIRRRIACNQKFTVLSDAFTAAQNQMLKLKRYEGLYANNMDDGDDDNSPATTTQPQVNALTSEVVHAIGHDGQRYTFHGSCYRCGIFGHKGAECPNQPQQQTGVSPSSSQQYTSIIPTPPRPPLGTTPIQPPVVQRTSTIHMQPLNAPVLSQQLSADYQLSSDAWDNVLDTLNEMTESQRLITQQNKAIVKGTQKILKGQNNYQKGNPRTPGRPRNNRTFDNNNKNQKNVRFATPPASKQTMPAQPVTNPAATNPISNPQPTPGTGSTSAGGAVITNNGDRRQADSVAQIESHNQRHQHQDDSTTTLPTDDSESEDDFMRSMSSALDSSSEDDDECDHE